jgi:hypothetical protein
MLPAHAHVILDFKLDSEPIAGSLQRVDGSTTEFNGWIELVSLLQGAATTPVAPGPIVDPRSNGRAHAPSRTD